LHLLFFKITRERHVQSGDRRPGFASRARDNPCDRYRLRRAAGDGVDGFSAGAGFTIRFAGGGYGGLFDRYVFLSPILPGAPTLRPNAGGWTNISVPRVVTIAWLDRLGMHVFDGFDVISYAVAPENKQATPSYSYRLF
jgi:hypothetical protein